MNASPHPFAAQALLRKLFAAALAAVDPMRVVPPFLPTPKAGARILILGAGKASARMAAAVEKTWADRTDLKMDGLVVTRYGHGQETRHVEIVEAGHPVPDANGQRAARRMLDLAGTAGSDDLVLCLISGGGSALLALPRAGMSFEHKQAIHRELLRCGAPISEMNCVRRHLSAVKGGRLAAACGQARVITLVISDVPGDDPAVVASGPSVPDGSTAHDAMAILERYGIEVPAILREGQTRCSAGPLSPREVHVVATAQDALTAAASTARDNGVFPLVLGGSLEGEARDMAAVHAGIARQIRAYGQPAKGPCVILSGGESTVSVVGDGRGGRNAEFLLALAMAAHDVPDMHALACDTDGIDGVEDNAGAFIDPGTLARARMISVDPGSHLRRNDAYGFFAQLGQLVVTGPTRTNVNDFRAILLP